MNAVNVSEVLRRYHLAPSQRAFQQRLDILTEQFFREHIETVFEHLGIPQREILCIRELNIPLVFDENQTDTQILQHWLETLEAIFEVQQQAQRWQSVVRYANLTEALKSVLRSLSCGYLEHRWCWKQLGILPTEHLDTEQITRHWVDFLVRQPQQIFAVMHGLIKQGYLFDIISKPLLTIEQLAVLTDGAISQLSFTPNWAAMIADLSEQHSAIGYDRNVQLKTASYQLLGHWRALLKIPESNGEQHLTEGQLRTLLKSLYWLVLAEAQTQTPTCSAVDFLSTGQGSLHKQLLSLAATVLKISDKEQQVAATPRQRHSYPLELGEPAISVGSSRIENLPELMGVEQLLQDVPSEQQAVGQYGGLLFLLNVINTPEWQAQLQDLLSDDCSMSQILHGLATTLLPESRGDAVVRIFCGTWFESTSTRQLEQLLANDTRETLAVMAVQLISEVTARLSQRGQKKSQQDVLAMFRRKVSIVSQPGWVNIGFDLADVDTDIRIGGLDLDPGLVPWLGYVVRFYYE